MTLPKSKPRIPSPSSSVDSISEDPNYDNSNITYLCHKDSISPKIELSEAQVDAILMERNLNPDPMVIHAREYQLEMFEESLKHNIIVAMETGTGKTQVAVLRIQAELEKSTPEKLIWFLAPTVALGEQQTRVLTSQIPAVQIKFLSGADGLDTWSDIRIWNDYLRNVRVVVSTYQVLLDAISHAFVPIDRLSLIVFDEAHNCVGKHPGSKIMERYYKNKNAGLPIPSILGLTASPIMKSKIEALEIIEQTLDAVCRSPRIHREELQSIVKRPTVTYSLYSDTNNTSFTKTTVSLIGVYDNLDIYEDPQVIYLQGENSERSRIELRKALETRSTFVQKQMMSFLNKSIEIQRQLGSWAVDYFISTVISQFLKSVKENDVLFSEWWRDDKKYLASALEQAKITALPPFEDAIASNSISDKFAALVRELSLAADENETIGIIFVKEIASVVVLSHMLSIHPLLKKRFRVGSMVGVNNYTGRKRDLSGLNRTSGYQDLQDFQNGKINLLVATSVLEEGIDVPACNMVVCFDMPSNLKAFIQRRGRARMRESKLVLLTDTATCKVDEWTALEEEMKKRYAEEIRREQELFELEESERPQVEPLLVPETGACLDFDQAKAHLEHFCKGLSLQSYSDTRPYYIFKRTNASSEDFPLIAATVVLPLSLPNLRRVESSRVWYSEKNASKDAAFQAYIAIYKAGLLNDNLLPLKDESLRQAQLRDSEVLVRGRWSPWPRIAQAWCRPAEVYQRRVRLIDQQDNVTCEFDVSMPILFPHLEDFEVFLAATIFWRVETSDVKILPAHDLQTDQSQALIDLAYRHRRVELKGTAMQHTLHVRSPTQDIPFQRLVGQDPIEVARLDDTAAIRTSDGNLSLFKKWLPCYDPSIQLPYTLREEPTEGPFLIVEKWPRRRPSWVKPVERTSQRLQSAWPVSLCRMDGTHISNIYFGAIIPVLMHKIEVSLIVTELCNTLLKDVGFSDMSLVTTAISAPAALETTHYQRLEFLGDMILKTITTATVTANNPNFPEGYLDAMKANIVSNARLYRSTIKTGLDKFILYESYMSKKWKPLYVQDLLEVDACEGKERKISTKVLADVVEALIGAAYLDGGMPKALACIKLFIPEVRWHSLEFACSALFNQTPMSEVLPPGLVPLEELIGYSFRNKNLLIDAATHSSFGFVNSAGSCMERMEFLGDAILDNIITSFIWAHKREMSQGEMHLFRVASVNADLLGFIGMEWSIPEEVTEISQDGLVTMVTKKKIPFWKFMRHMSQELRIAQNVAEEKHMLERDAILDVIGHGKTYPWTQLAHLHIPKFFSDFFESVLGAVWVDSSGCMDTCARVVERAGILPYLQRMLVENVDTLHPKNRLGQHAAFKSQSVEYQSEIRDDTADGSGKKELVCRVLVADEVIVEVGGGVSREEVLTRAADAAYKIIIERERGNEVEAMNDDDDDVMNG